MNVAVIPTNPMLEDLDIPETVQAIDEILRSLEVDDELRNSVSYAHVKSMIEQQRAVVASGDFSEIDGAVTRMSRYLSDSFDWDDPLYKSIGRANTLANHLVRRWKRGEFVPK